MQIGAGVVLLIGIFMIFGLIMDSVKGNGKKK